MKVSIGHLTFEVSRRDRDEGLQFSGPSLSGICNRNNGTVTLYSGASPSEEAATLVHELLHAIWHAYALPEEINEEDACRRLEGPLLALMADNPQVVAALIAARGGLPLNLD